MTPAEHQPAQGEPEWTAGPWRVGLGDRGSCTIRAVSDGELVAEVWLTKTQRHKANTRLIAATPELYRALKWFINDIDGTHTVMVEFDKNVELARAALAERGRK